MPNIQALQSIQGLKSLVETARQQGRDDKETVDRFVANQGINQEVRNVMTVARQRGIQDSKIVDDLLAASAEFTKQQYGQIFTRPASEQAAEFGGEEKLVKVSEFFGVEKAVRRLVTGIKKSDEQYLKEAGVSDTDVDIIKKSGVSDGEFAGSLALIALNVATPLAIGKLAGAVAGQLPAGGLTLGGRILTGAGTGAITGGAFGAAHGLQRAGEVEDMFGGGVKGVALGGLIGGAIPLAIAVGKTVLYGLKNAGLALTGKTPAEAQAILKYPRGAQRGILGGKGEVVKVSQELRKTADSKLTALNKSYGEQSKKIFTKYSPEGGARHADAWTLNRKETLNSIKQGFMSFSRDGKPTGITFTKSGQINLSNSPFVGTEATHITRAWEMASKHQDWTVRGANTLREKMAKLINFAEGEATKESITITNAWNGLRNKLYAKAPELGALNAQYSDKINFLQDFGDVFATGKPGPLGEITTYKRLMNLYGRNQELTRQFVDELSKEAGIDVLGTVAGARFVEPAAGGITGVGSALVRGTVSPVTGLGLSLAGEVGRGLPDQFLQRLFLRAGTAVSPAARQALYNYIGQRAAKNVWD